eukprot:14679155-Alexandrium_andersonii.AAC.1
MPTVAIPTGMLAREMLVRGFGGLATASRCSVTPSPATACAALSSAPKIRTSGSCSGKRVPQSDLSLDRALW